MINLKCVRSVLVVIAALSMCAGLLGAGCSDDPPPKYLDGQTDTGGDSNWKPDQPGAKLDGQPIPDQPSNPDQPVWPDIWPDTSGGQDWYTPPDQYVGSPFGCKADSDCFGQKCCPTPWGVKLCAPSCELK